MSDLAEADSADSAAAAESAGAAAMRLLRDRSGSATPPWPARCTAGVEGEGHPAGVPYRLRICRAVRTRRSRSGAGLSTST